MRIVFMGTPDFAAASLNMLITEGYDLAGVFTQPDRPRGRGMAVRFSPVKTLALAHGLPVFQPETLRGEDAVSQLRALSPEIVAVVAYGRILPEPFLTLPPLGCVNVHGSLLPKYRGSAPIQWAVLNGERTTGVSTMYLTREMDAGDVILTRETEIGEFETSGELFDRLKDMGAELLRETLAAIAAGRAERHPQDPAQATYTRPLDKSMAPIDWRRTPREIVKQICGLQPWPVAVMELEGKPVRVFAAEYTDAVTDSPPGTLLRAGREGLDVACGGGGVLRITELQAPGKRRMTAGAYLRGHPVRRELK